MFYPNPAYQASVNEFVYAKIRCLLELAMSLCCTRFEAGILLIQSVEPD